MEIRFQGRKAVVTGGVNGIGRAMAQRLAESGAEVFVFDVEQGSFDFPALLVPCDVTDRNSLRAAFDRLGAPPDVVMANAGTSFVRPIEETTAEVWDKTLALNLTGVFLTLQEAAIRMKAAGRGGAIVVTAATNSYDGEEQLIAYNATKAGVLGIVHTAANELGPYGIRVNAVNPGLIQTRLTQSSFDEEAVVKPYFQAIPMGRGGRPAEVAAAAAFLASDWASYITGATLLVDGGQMCCKFGPWKESTAEFQEGRWRFRD
jgi:NAD(P)-dependent dehydrogenase (short-subunit alcohol dehydrogenase family)